LRQAHLLYRLFQKGFFQFEELRPLIQKPGEIWWFREEMGEEIPDIELYRKRRDEWRGFNVVMDAIIHDEVGTLEPIITLQNYDKEKAGFPEPAEQAQQGANDDPYKDFRIEDNEDFYPVSMGYNETQRHTLLEYACRWGAENCVRRLMVEGAKPGPGALWCAIQSGNIELMRMMMNKIDEGTQPLEGLDLHNAISFAIRYHRPDALSWLLRTKQVEWNQFLVGWITDNAYMTNNILAIDQVYQHLRRARREKTSWWHLVFPVYHGNLQLLHMFPLLDHKDASDDDRDNYVKWAMRSNRREVVAWFCQTYPILAQTHVDWMKGEKCREREFYKAWLRLRPDYVEDIARVAPQVTAFVNEAAA